MMDRTNLEKLYQQYKEIMDVIGKEAHERREVARLALRERLEALREAAHEELKAIRIIEQKTKRSE